jgi:amidase
LYLLQQKRTTINSDNLFNDTLSYILKSKVTLVTNFNKYYLITPYKIMLKINQQIIFCFLIYLLLFSSCQKRTKSSPTNTFELNEITIDEIHNGYDSGKYTVREIVSQYIKRIENIDQSGPELNSIIIVNPDALAIADSLDKIQKKGKKKGPLFGIPVLLKDNIDTHDKMPTTGGSRILKDSYPLSDSWVAKKLRESGAVILGKTNLSEWANYRASYSSSGWSGVGGQTKNPYVLDRNPCGSSSGSAVAVSANLCVIAIGTETWGSIMCPSNANGIVGIKPTVGLWSRSGIIPISYTQDTAGPMSRTVRDAAKLLGVITGIDLNDPKTKKSIGNRHINYTRFLRENGLVGKRIGYLKTIEGKNYRVDELMYLAIEDLQAQGATIIELEKIVEGAPDAEQSSLEVMAHEFKDGLKKYFDNLGENAPVANLKEAIEATIADSIEMLYFNLERMKNAETKDGLNSKIYKDALKNMLKSFREQGLDRIMKKHKLDAIVSPTGSPAWKTDLINGDKYYISSTVYAALSGYPNINVPMGFIGNVPVGISFYGRAWSEPQLLEIAYAYEQFTNHRDSPKFLLTD